MKLKKRLLAELMVATMSLGMLFGCGVGEGNAKEVNDTAVNDTANVEKKHKIVVYSLKATGSIVDSVDAFLDLVDDELGFEYEVRFAGDDAATLLGNVETAMAENFDGVISMTDKGNNAAILELCEENGVYFGGTWSNQGSSLNSSESGYDMLKSKNYVGSIADGMDSYDVEVAIYAKQIADNYNALPDEEKEGSIGITTNPSKWTPGQQIAAQNMYETLTTEYKIPESAFATATIEQRAEEESYAGTALASGTWQFPQVDVSSKSLPAAYFMSNTNLKLICSFASITYIEPALQTAGLHGKVKVWTCGYEAEDYLLNNFAELGDQTYQGFRTAPIEAVAFPLVQILDKLNGKEYSDKTEKVGELIGKMDSEMGAKFQLKNYMIPSSSSIVVTKADEFNAFKDNYIYSNGKDSIVTADDLKKLMVTYNENATYEELVSFFNNTGSLDINAILK